ncbi:hypothetical protein CFAM422_007640 [Trichoderma lentiforme]|uniref:Uncharacterized protein n=1 Tax=Trichoderma lentiforme TaxID=1567552 RepID=A0A9P5CDF3_9HYPO|nr:hypothetical protein CFAM422_007640 [Trichoderma lentiforme]
MPKVGMNAPAMANVHIWPIPFGFAHIRDMEGSKTGSVEIGAYGVRKLAGTAVRLSCLPALSTTVVQINPKA